MASGKSAVGHLLASKLNVPFIDLDAYIESKEKKSITTIFEEKGEIYFRLKETTYLTKLLQNDESFVLSLGGGTPCYGNNMNIILENSTSYYLKTSIDTIYNRIVAEKSKRPLVASITDDKLKEFIAKHLFERAFFYNKSNKMVNTDKLTIEEVVNEINKN